MRIEKLIEGTREISDPRRSYVNHMREYSNCKLTEKIDGSYDFPVGILTHELGDIVVYFTHYNSFDEAKQKWVERTKRIDYDNLYIIMEMGKKTAPELLDGFECIPYKNKVVITDDQNESRSSFALDIYNEDYFPGKILDLKHKFGIKRHIDDFDYVTFLNTGEIRRRK